MKYRALLLDFGGVLSSYGRRGDGLDQLLRHLGVEPSDGKYDKIWPLLDKFKVGKLTNEEFWQKLAEFHGKDVPDDIEDVWKIDFPLHKELVAYIKKKRNEGIITAILSNVWPPTRLHLLDLGHYEGYDHVFLSDELGMAKPDPEIFEHSAKEMGVKPEETIFIDDQEKNTVAAEKLGMETILAVDEAQILDELKKLLGD